MLPIVFISAIFVAVGIVAASALVASAVVLQRKRKEEEARARGVVFAPEVREQSTLTSRIIGILPVQYIERLEAQLVFAGRPDAWPLQRIISAKFSLGLIGVALAVLWFLDDPGAVRVLVGLGLIALGFFVPDLLLSSKASERQTQIARDLPDTLDQMTIAVEAGLGFDAAMSKVGATGSGPLAEEFVRTLQDMSLGLSRREAYDAMAERTSSEDVRRFTRAISQAESYGIAVAKVLRVQAGEMRLKRRQMAEERAMKIPVKIVFPLTVCILPVLFIVILTPAVLNIVKVFSS